jgi:hypothetical protein
LLKSGFSPCLFVLTAGQAVDFLASVLRALPMGHEHRKGIINAVKCSIFLTLRAELARTS